MGFPSREGQYTIFSPICQSLLEKFITIANFKRSFSVKMPFLYRILYFRRRLSAIMAMNSELVGLPRLFWMV